MGKPGRFLVVQGVQDSHAFTADRFQSLSRELRSHKLRGTAEGKKQQCFQLPQRETSQRTPGTEHAPQRPEQKHKKRCERGTPHWVCRARAKTESWSLGTSMPPKRDVSGKNFKASSGSSCGDSQPQFTLPLKLKTSCQISD